METSGKTKLTNLRVKHYYVIHEEAENNQTNKRFQNTTLYCKARRSIKRRSHVRNDSFLEIRAIRHLLLGLFLFWGSTSLSFRKTILMTHAILNTLNLKCKILH